MAAPLAVVGIGSAIAGSATSALGAAFTGSAQANMYNYQAAVANMNSQIAKQNADYEVALGEQRTQKVAMASQARTGTITAGAGASGLDINSGSKSEVIASSEKLGQYDEAIQRSDAARRAYGYEVEAADFTAQGALDTAAASTSKTAAEFNVAKSIIGGVGSVADKWYSGVQSGIFPSA